MASGLSEVMAMSCRMDRGKGNEEGSTQKKENMKSY